MKQLLLALLAAAPCTAWSSLITVNSFTNIQFWTGSGTNRAALVLDFGSPETPSSIAWGYRWNGSSATAATMLFSLAGTITGASAPAPLPGSDSRLSVDVTFWSSEDGFFVNSIKYDQVGLPSPWTQGLRVITNDYFVDSTYPTFYTLNGTGGVWTGASFVLSTNAGMSATPLLNGMWVGFTQSDGEAANLLFAQPAAAVPEPRSILLLAVAAGLVVFALRRDLQR